MKSMLGMMLGVVCCVVGSMVPAPLGAAGLPPECRTPYETIFPLRDPVFDTLQLWHSFVGEGGRDRFADALAMPDGEWIMVGDSLAAPDARGAVTAPAQLYLAHLDARGRPQQEWRLDVPGLARVQRALVGGDRLYVLSAITHGGRAAGMITVMPWPLPRKTVEPITPVAAPATPEKPNTSKKTTDSQPTKSPGLEDRLTHILLSERGADLRVHDLAYHPARSRLYALTQRAGDKAVPPFFARLYVLNETGAIQHHRDYNTGLSSRLNRVRVLDDGSLVAAGAMDDGKGRMQGWTAGLGPDGGLLWQEIYPRGASASLSDIVPMDDGRFVATGDALPQDGTPPAAWVIALGTGGTPEWERFYSGNFIFGGVGIDAEKADGRITVLVSGQPASTADRRIARTHARFLTLSPNATLINDEAVSHGAGSTPTRLVRDAAGRRFAVGFAQSAVATKTDDTAYESLQDGWVVALPSLTAYRDPCRPKPLFAR